MSSPLIQLLVLAAVALFLVFKLKNVLGTREGFEKPPEQPAPPRKAFEVIEGGGPDQDILDHCEAGSPKALALAEIKRAEHDFNVNDFLKGARGAYEMIVIAFENGDIDEIRGFIDDDIEEAFDEAIAARKAEGLTVEATFIGLREMTLLNASYDATTRQAEITVHYTAELTRVVRDAAGEIVEGSDKDIKRQRDTWTFGRVMGASDPNWNLIATEA